MDYEKIFLTLFSVAGFWKFIELIIKLGFEKKLKKAEAGSLAAQANNLIVSNWVQWSQTLEKKVTELESLASSMEETIGKQRLRILEMEKHISKLEKRNKELEGKLAELNSK